MALRILTYYSIPKPKDLSIRHEKGSHLNANEEFVLDWVKRKIGGEILILKKIEKNGFTTPDLKMQKFAEIKNTSGSLNTLDKHIRTAAKQTKQGWVFVNIDNAKYSDKKAIETVSNRMLRSGLSEAWIIRGKKFVAHLVLSDQ